MRKLLLITVATILLATNWSVRQPAHALVDTIYVDSTWAQADTVLTIYRFHIVTYIVNLTDTIWDTSLVETAMLRYGDSFPDTGMVHMLMNALSFGEEGQVLIELAESDTMYAVVGREGRPPNIAYWSNGTAPWLHRFVVLIYDSTGSQLP